MIMSWTTYKCPHCGEKLSDSDIAEIHFKKKCQYCNAKVLINGHEALTNTMTAGFLAILAIGVYLILTMDVIISYSKAGFFRDIPKLLFYIFFILYLSGGLLSAIVITKIYKNIMLSIATKKNV